MTVQSIEVEVVDGEVRPLPGGKLPDEGRGVLTIFKPTSDGKSGGGLAAFLKAPKFEVDPEAFRESMAADYWDQ